MQHTSSISNSVANSNNQLHSRFRFLSIYSYDNKYNNNNNDNNNNDCQNDNINDDNIKFNNIIDKIDKIDKKKINKSSNINDKDGEDDKDGKSVVGSLIGVKHCHHEGDSLTNENVGYCGKNMVFVKMILVIYCLIIFFKNVII